MYNVYMYKKSGAGPANAGRSYMSIIITFRCGKEIHPASTIKL